MWTIECTDAMLTGHIIVIVINITIVDAKIVILRSITRTKYATGHTRRQCATSRNESKSNNKLRR